MSDVKWMPILLVGGPRLGILGRWFRCKVGSTTFTLDRPESDGKNPFQGGGLCMVRYMWRVYAPDDCDFLVGAYAWDWK